MNGHGKGHALNIISLFFDLLSKPFRDRWVEFFFRVLFGSLAMLFGFLMPRPLLVRG